MYLYFVENTDDRKKLLNNGHKKAASCDAAFSEVKISRLTLGELEAGAGAGTTGLLAFLHPRVAGKEAFWLDQLAVLRVEESE